MFDDLLRRLKDRLLEPIARRLGATVSPHAVTILAFVAGLASALAVLAGYWSGGLTLWLVNRLLDGLDGTHARLHGRSTPFGAYLDIVLDFVVYAAIPASMALASRSFEVALAAVALLAAYYVNAASWMYLSALLEQRQQGARATGELTTVTMPRGLIAGTETVVAYVLFFLWPSRLPALFGVMAFLVLVTAAQRLVWARRHL